jgi:hypothetical protein
MVLVLLPEYLGLDLGMGIPAARGLQVDCCFGLRLKSLQVYEGLLGFQAIVEEVAHEQKDGGTNMGIV